jgi:hypothetical protein
MNSRVFALIAVAALPAWSAAWSAEMTPVSAPAAQATPEQQVEAFRRDLQAKRADVMAKGLTLTSEQAAKFWPLYEQFQKDQSAIVDAQLKATQKYGEHFKSLTDADAVEYVSALLTRDAKMNELRVKWLKKFQDVVPPKLAARAIQLDRRLGQVTQVGLSSQIPLVQ